MNLGSKDTNSLTTRGLLIGEKGIMIPFPAVMGILNITQDSFYDGGRYLTED
ncbi:MAG TPA: hypothetical protein PK976_04010 [Bacteroidales bacterium]|nr:hypothetical protein [Bacteroidales bacterium]